MQKVILPLFLFLSSVVTLTMNEPEMVNLIKYSLKCSYCPYHTDYYYRKNIAKVFFEFHFCTISPSKEPSYLKKLVPMPIETVKREHMERFLASTDESENDNTALFSSEPPLSAFEYEKTEEALDDSCLDKWVPKRKQTPLSYRRKKTKKTSDTAHIKRNSISLQEAHPYVQQFKKNDIESDS